MTPLNHVNPSLSITLDEIPPITCHITCTHGKTPANEETPPSPIKCAPLVKPTPISTSSSNNSDKSENESWNPTLSNSPAYSLV